MSSGEVSKPGPSASLPLTRELARKKAGHSERRRGGRTAGRSQSGVSVQYVETVSSAEDLKSEFPSIMSEIFKEDLAYRALARKFLWEFFD